MRKCSCAEAVHDLDSPEGLLEHCLVLGEVKGMPQDVRDRFRALLTQCLAGVTPIPALWLAALTDADCTAEGLATARLGVQMVSRLLDQLEVEIRHRQTRKWMAEASK